MIRQSEATKQTSAVFKHIIRFVLFMGGSFAVGLLLLVGLFVLFLLFVTGGLDIKGNRIYKYGKPIGDSCYREYNGKIYAFYRHKDEFITYYYQKLDKVKPENFELLKDFKCIGIDKTTDILYIAQIPFKDVDIPTFRLIQTNISGYTIFGDKNRLYLVNSYPLGPIEGGVDYKIFNDGNIYTVRSYGNVNLLVTPHNVFFDGVLLEGLDPQSTYYEPFPSSRRAYVIFDTINGRAYCNEEKTDLNVKQLAFYKFIDWKDPENPRVYEVVGDGASFYDSSCTKLDPQKIKNKNAELRLTSKIAPINKVL